MDKSHLDDHSLETSILHAKYLRLYSNQKLLLQKLQNDFIQLKSKKRAWVLGEMNKQVLDAEGWKPWLKTTPLKNQVDEILEADEDCMMLKSKVFLQSEKVGALENIIKLLNNRTYQISTAVNFMKFQNGVM
jgi:hypothetical protein